VLTIAATHMRPRFVLPAVVKDFRDTHRRVALHLQQCSPRQIAQLLLVGDLGLGIATEAVERALAGAAGEALSAN
jgi:LysR family cys regulon transcriptional activator